MGLEEAEGVDVVAHQQVLGVLVVVQVRLAILVHADKTPAHVAGLRQWAGDVAFGAVVVPGTEGLGYRGLEGSRGFLRIKLTVAEGSPAPLSRPADPLMISRWSYTAMSVLVVP